MDTRKKLSHVATIRREFAYKEKKRKLNGVAVILDGISFDTFDPADSHASEVSMDTNKHLKVKSVMEHSSALVNHVGQEVLGKMMAGGCCGGQEALGLNITNRSPDSLPHEKKERLLSRRLSHSLEVESAMECAVAHGSYVGHVIPGLKSINHSSDFVLHDKKRSGSQSSSEGEKISTPPNRSCHTSLWKISSRRRRR